MHCVAGMGGEKKHARPGERSAELILGCYTAGKELPVLPEKTVKMAPHHGDLIA